MMNGISLVCHYTLLFYVGVNSNGGRERGGERREKERGVLIPACGICASVGFMSLDTTRDV